MTVQAGILDVLRDLRTETGTAVLLITHDLGVVADIADRVVVMYAGRVIEEAGTEALFARHNHPYTRGLLDAVPNPAATPTAGCGRSPAGCRRCARSPDACTFADRCAHADERAGRAAPGAGAGPGRAPVRCWHPLHADAAARAATAEAYVDDRSWRPRSWTWSSTSARCGRSTG